MTPPPLAGFTVGVTADRHASVLAGLLTRSGARVVQAPTARTATLPDNAGLERATRSCLVAPLDEVVIATAVGFRRWMHAAECCGLAGPLLSRLAAATITTQGPSARDTVRAAGLTDVWSPIPESAAALRHRLLGKDHAGRRIAVQMDGSPQLELIGPLRQAGADVIEVPLYRWAEPVSLTPVYRLIGDILDGGLDALVFTTAPAVSGLLWTAAEAGRREELLARLRAGTTVACVGPTTAAPLERCGVPVLQPQRSRLGALARVVAAEVPRRRSRRLKVGGLSIELRGHAVIVDGSVRPVSGAPMAILRALAARPGNVVGRAELRRALPNGAAVGDHAVDVAVARLRRALGRSQLVETVIKRGYRLTCDRVETDEVRSALLAHPVGARQR